MTLAEILEAIQHRGYGTDTEDAQTAMVNSVYRRIIGMRRWPFLEARGTITAVAGTDTYDLSTEIADLLSVDAVRAEFNTDYYTLEYKSPQALRDDEHLYRDQETPMYWTRIEDDLILSPPPNKAYTIVVDYIKRPTDLTAAAHEPIFPDTFHDVLVWGAIAELAVRERDYNGRTFALDEYGQRLTDMMNHYGVRQRQTADEVVRSGYWDSPNRYGPDLWLSG